MHYLLVELFAYWEWTPETGRWINPKYYVGATSAEQWEIAMNTYKAGDYEKALREFKKLLEYFPTSTEASRGTVYDRRLL